LGLREGKYQELGEDCRTRGFVIFASHRIFSGNQIKEDEMGGTRSTNWEKRYTRTALLEKRERKRPLERATNRWEDNIKMVVKLTGNLAVNWIRVA
jgi:hypothetical protein